MVTHLLGHERLVWNLVCSCCPVSFSSIHFPDQHIQPVARHKGDGCEGETDGYLEIVDIEPKPRDPLEDIPQPSHQRYQDFEGEVDACETTNCEPCPTVQVAGEKEN